MQELKCPNCGEVFQVDETGYAQLARQVRDEEFSKELERRTKELELRQERELALLRSQDEKEYVANISKKDIEISAKEQLIAQLQAKLDAGEIAKNLAVTEAIEKKNREISDEAKKYSGTSLDILQQCAFNYLELGKNEEAIDERLKHLTDTFQ